MDDRTEGGLLADYFSESELAAELGKDIRTIQRYRVLREGPPVTFIGKTPFYNKGSARAWLKAREQRTARNRWRGRGVAVSGAG
jgi:hypothetical protein